MIKLSSWGSSSKLPVARPQSSWVMALESVPLGLHIQALPLTNRASVPSRLKWGTLVPSAWEGAVKRQ